MPLGLAKLARSAGGEGGTSGDGRSARPKPRFSLNKHYAGLCQQIEGFDMFTRKEGKSELRVGGRLRDDGAGAGDGHPEEPALYHNNQHLPDERDHNDHRADPPEHRSRHIALRSELNGSAEKQSMIQWEDATALRLGKYRYDPDRITPTAAPRPHQQAGAISAEETRRGVESDQGGRSKRRLADMMDKMDIPVSKSTARLPSHLEAVLFPPTPPLAHSAMNQLSSSDEAIGTPGRHHSMTQGGGYDNEVQDGDYDAHASDEYGDGRYDGRHHDFVGDAHQQPRAEWGTGEEGGDRYLGIDGWYGEGADHTGQRWGRKNGSGRDGIQRRDVCGDVSVPPPGSEYGQMRAPRQYLTPTPATVRPPPNHASAIDHNSAVDAFPVHARHAHGSHAPDLLPQGEDRHHQPHHQAQVRPLQQPNQHQPTTFAPGFPSYPPYPPHLAYPYQYGYPPYPFGYPHAGPPTGRPGVVPDAASAHQPWTEQAPPHHSHPHTHPPMPPYGHTGWYGHHPAYSAPYYPYPTAPPSGPDQRFYKNTSSAYPQSLDRQPAMTGIPPHWSHPPTHHAPYPPPSHPSTSFPTSVQRLPDSVIAQMGEQGLHRDQSTSSAPTLTSADRHGTDKLPSREPSESIGGGIPDALRQAHARLHSDTGTDVDMEGAVGVALGTPHAHTKQVEEPELDSHDADAVEDEEEAQEDWETYVKRRLHAEKRSKSKKIAGDRKDGQSTHERLQGESGSGHAKRDGGRVEGASHKKRRGAMDGESADGTSKKVSRRGAEVREGTDTATHAGTGPDQHKTPRKASVVRSQPPTASRQSDARQPPSIQRRERQSGASHPVTPAKKDAARLSYMPSKQILRKPQKAHAARAVSERSQASQQVNPQNTPQGQPHSLDRSQRQPAADSGRNDGAASATMRIIATQPDEPVTPLRSALKQPSSSEERAAKRARKTRFELPSDSESEGEGDEGDDAAVGVDVGMEDMDTPSKKGPVVSGRLGPAGRPRSRAPPSGASAQAQPTERGERERGRSVPQMTRSRRFVPRKSEQEQHEVKSSEQQIAPDLHVLESGLDHNPTDLPRSTQKISSRPRPIEYRPGRLSDPTAPTSDPVDDAHSDDHDSTESYSPSPSPTGYIKVTDAALLPSLPLGTVPPLPFKPIKPRRQPGLVPRPISEIREPIDDGPMTIPDESGRGAGLEQIPYLPIDQRPRNALGQFLPYAKTRLGDDGDARWELEEADREEIDEFPSQSQSQTLSDTRSPSPETTQRYQGQEAWDSHQEGMMHEDEYELSQRYEDVVSQARDGDEMLIGGGNGQGHRQARGGGKGKGRLDGQMLSPVKEEEEYEYDDDEELESDDGKMDVDVELTGTYEDDAEAEYAGETARPLIPTYQSRLTRQQDPPRQVPITPQRKQHNHPQSPSPHSDRRSSSKNTRSPDVTSISAMQQQSTRLQPQDDGSRHRGSYSKADEAHEGKGFGEGFFEPGEGNGFAIWRDEY